MAEETREDSVKEEAVSKGPAESEEVSEELADELVKALEEESIEEEDLKPSPEKKGKLGTLFTIMGLILGIAGIGAGAYTLWNLVNRPPLVGLPEGPSEKSPKPPLEAPKEPLGAQPIKPVMKYSLVLKNFLVPLQSEGGAPVFIKATVVLYFESQREVLLAQKLENPLRGLIFDVLKKIPFYYWRSKEGISKTREILFETLKTKAPEGLRPKRVEVTGYILK